MTLAFFPSIESNQCSYHHYNKTFPCTHPAPQGVSKGADALETGEEDVVMEALRAYNREVSGSCRLGTCREEVGPGGARARGRQEGRQEW